MPQSHGLRMQAVDRPRDWARGQAPLDPRWRHPALHAPSQLSTHLAMVRKASSTFMPVLALVSMKGTPYSCQGESVLRGQSWAAPIPSRPPPASHLPWPASLRPLSGSPFHCSHLPVKPRWVTLGEGCLGPSLCPGSGTSCPLLVVCGTAGGLIHPGPGPPPRVLSS